MAGGIELTIGGSIALIILGAILAFAVQIDIGGLDINTIGIILMIGGAIGLVFGLALYARTARTADRRVVRDREPL